MEDKEKRLLSVVVSVYNEELVLEDFLAETQAVLETIPWEYELIFVNDGSQDTSLMLLEQFVKRNSHIRLINFSRNFGHEAAMIAGIDYSRGDGVICMDADLQHPPACIPEIVQKFEEGYGVVNLVRTQNKDAGFFKNVTSTAFYKVLNLLSPVHFEENASDFLAFSRAAANVLRQAYRERVRFLRGYVQSLGFPKTTLYYEARERQAGKSKYNIGKLVKFSVNSLLCFSDMPLKLGIYSGCFMALVGLVVMIYTIYSKLAHGTPSGYATIVVLLCFMFSLLMVIVGIIGEYVAILFAEVKGRPIYIVERVEGLETDPRATPKEKSGPTSENASLDGRQEGKLPG